MKTNTLFSKTSSRLCTVVLIVAGISLFSFSGCKPQKIAPPAPTPTPTPIPALGNVIFVQGGHLVELNFANSQITPLTSGKSTEWFPVASPQGDQVVYWSNANSDVYNLWKLNLLTSQRTQLTFNDDLGLTSSEQNLLINTFASWSSDGKSIIYSQDGDLWAMDENGYNPKTILAGHEALCPRFSPDGKSVLYISNLNDTAYNLYVFDIPDQTLKQITHYTDWNVGSPSYSADGSKILYNLYRDDETQIYTIQLSDSTSLNLNNNLHSLSPQFGQKDKKIYFAAYGTGVDATMNIYVMNSNGTDVKALTVNGGTSPTWLPALSAIPTPTAHN